MKLLFTIDEYNFGGWLEVGDDLVFLGLRTNERVGDRWTGRWSSEVEIRKPTGEQFFVEMEKTFAFIEHADEESYIEGRSSFVLKNFSEAELKISELEIGTTVWIQD